MKGLIRSENAGVVCHTVLVVPSVGEMEQCETSLRLNGDPSPAQNVQDVLLREMRHDSFKYLS